MSQHCTVCGKVGCVHAGDQVCVVCGDPIPSGHGRFVLPGGHHVHQGCKPRIGLIESASQVSGQRPNSMYAYSPETAALRYLWGRSYHAAESYVQRNEGCAHNPGWWQDESGRNRYCCDEHRQELEARAGEARAGGTETLAHPVHHGSHYDPPLYHDVVRTHAEAWKRMYGGAYGSGGEVLARAPHHGKVPAVEFTRVGAVDLPSDEKFLDPRIACGAIVDPVDGSGNVNRYAAIGYLLKTPNNAKARIAAIRKKVNDFKAEDRKPGKGVKMISDLSVSALEELSKDLYLRYQEVLRESTDPKRVEEFAKKMGKSVPEVLREAPDVIQSYTGFDVRQLGDIGKEVWAAIGPLIIKELKELAKTFEETAKAATDAASGLADAASAVPLFGAMFSAGVKMFVAANKEADERYQTLCNDFIQGSVTDPMKKTMNRGLPIPWHALEWNLGCRTREDMLDVKRWTPTPDQEATAYAFKTNLKRWETIHDISLLAEAGRWWTLATQLMGVKEIEPIFAALGNNAEGAGLLASDEQVMLVAAPIAISYGFPVDEFAERLWNKSEGWRAAGPLLKPEPVKHYAYDADGMPVVSSVTCEKEPANALQLQWGLLARDAFALADQVKKEKVVKAQAEEKLQTANVPSILGGLATGALALYGAPVLLAALPLAVGYLLTRRARAASLEEHPEEPKPEPGPTSKYEDFKVALPRATPKLGFGR